MASDYDKPMIAGERDIFETYFDDPKFSNLTLKPSFLVISDYPAGSDIQANRGQ
jgi:hypothetical protein